MIRNKRKTPHIAGPWKDHYLYTTYWGIKRRCHDTRAAGYGAYGGRGIEMCARWRADFVSFVDDVVSSIGERPTRGHTIDRIDRDGDYEPGNIRWASSGQQARNKSTNVWLEMDGERFVAADLAKRLGVNPRTFSAALALRDVMLRIKPVDGPVDCVDPGLV